MATLNAAGFSDKGARKHNEDALLLCDDLGLYIVADGVGGVKGGEVASGIVCTTIAEKVRAGASLSVAMDDAHEEVIAAAAKGEGVKGSASTAVAAQFEGALLQLAWVGDSRAYLWDGELQLLSKDHSLVQSLVDTAQLDFAQMEQHPQKNVITQALGSRNGPPVTASKRGHLKTPCVVMLCSDGVSGELTERQLIAELSSDQSAQACAKTLVETAVNGGGQDNASCIVINIPKLPAAGHKEPMLAFMRYSTNNLWQLAAIESVDEITDETQINLSASRPVHATQRGPLRKIVYTAIGFGVLAVLLYGLQHTVGWEPLFDLIKQKQNG